MERMTRSILAMGCILLMVVSFFEPGWLVLVLLALGYGFLGMVFWYDRDHRQVLLWVMYALMLFSVIMGHLFWHRIFRVGFWVAMLFAGRRAGETRGRLMDMVALFVWGISCVFALSSWQWWVGVIDGISWFVLAGLLVMQEKQDQKGSV